MIIYSDSFGFREAPDDYEPSILTEILCLRREDFSFALAYEALDRPKYVIYSVDGHFHIVNLRSHDGKTFLKYVDRAVRVGAEFAFDFLSAIPDAYEFAEPILRAKNGQWELPPLDP